MAEDDVTGAWRARVDATPAAVIAAATGVGFAHVATEHDAAKLVRDHETLTVWAAANEGATVRYEGPNGTPAHELTGVLAAFGRVEEVAPAAQSSARPAARLGTGPAVAGEVTGAGPSAFTEGIDGAVVLFTDERPASPPEVATGPAASGAAASTGTACDDAIAPPTGAATDVRVRRVRTALVVAGLSIVTVCGAVWLVSGVRHADSSDTRTASSSDRSGQLTTTAPSSVATTSTYLSTTSAATATVPPTVTQPTVALAPTQPSTTAAPAVVHRVIAHELSVRSSPSVSASEARPDLHTGDLVAIVCQRTGGPIPPDRGAEGDLTLWDQLDDGNWVADIYVDTTKPRGTWRDPALPGC